MQFVLRSGLAIAVFASFTSLASAQSYTIRRLTAPGLAHGFAWEIDNQNRICGDQLDSTGYAQPVVWVNGVATQLPVHSGGAEGSVRFIADNGLMGGIAADSSTAAMGTLWQPTSGSTWGEVAMGMLPSHFYSGVQGINANGQCAGFSDTGVSIHPVAWPDDASVGSPQLLPTSPFAEGDATAITANGTIVGHIWSGSASTPSFWVQTGSTWSRSSLPTLGVSWGLVQDVVSNNHFVGCCTSPATGRIHLTEWVSGSITDLGNLSGMDCVPESVNANGDLAGWARTFSTPPYVAIQKRAGQSIQVLDTLLPPQSAWQLSRAWGINDAGVIVGSGNLNGFQEAFVMIPTQVAQSAPVPGTANTNNTITVTGAGPGNTVSFLVSGFGGESLVPGCLEGLDIGSPIGIGTTTANGAGAASLTFFVPGSVAGIPLLFQAFDQGACHTSNVVQHTF